MSQERFTRSSGGTSYGIELSIDQSGPLRPGPVRIVALVGSMAFFGYFSAVTVADRIPTLF